jgi:hypothetical protein
MVQRVQTDSLIEQRIADAKKFARERLNQFLDIQLAVRQDHLWLYYTIDACKKLRTEQQARKAA